MGNRAVSRKQSPAKAVKEVVVSRASSGPLPDPDVFQRYEEILPGAAERILAMAEANAAARREAQQRDLEATIAAVNRQIDRQTRGQWLGFGISILALFVTLVALLTGHPATAGVLGSTTVIGLATVFVLGQKYGEKPAVPEKPQDKN